MFFISVYFLPFYPNSPKDQNFKRMKKKNTMLWDIIILHMCTKLWSDNVRFLSMVCNRQTGGCQKKWHMEVGAPPKNGMPGQNWNHAISKCVHNHRNNNISWRYKHQCKWAIKTTKSIPRTFWKHQPCSTHQFTYKQRN